VRRAFVVTAPPAEPVGRDAASAPETAVLLFTGQPDATDGAMARINFRPPEGLPRVDTVQDETRRIG
jgi:hypothetical protein